MVDSREMAIQPVNLCLRSQLCLSSEITIPYWTEGTNLSCALSEADNTVRRYFSC